MIHHRVGLEMNRVEARVREVPRHDFWKHHVAASSSLEIGIAHVLLLHDYLCDQQRINEY